jgi:hypothetical protein
MPLGQRIPHMRPEWRLGILEAPSRALNGFGDVYFDYDLV